MLVSPKNIFSPGRNFQWLSDLMDQKVIDWLDIKTKNLLLDYLVLRKSYEEYAIGKESITDYSYLITPAFKALEGTLIQIARELGIDLEKYKFKIGVIFSEENLETFYNETLDKIENLSEENKLDIQQWLNNARRLLRHLRHSPAHYQGEVKENFNQAFMTGDQIIFTIKEMCLSLLNSGIIKENNQVKPKASIYTPC